MEKPTIFFSHSSKDKDAMNYLKKIINEKTGGVLNIFLSSDGESIPFGTNWIHSIEQGLNNSIIMYVFITPNSIRSDWIFFESGFAYSKNVKVIPIGLGVSISLLNPPLSLLQGFNLTSFEGLNNIIKTINDECQTTFPENFQESDYNRLQDCANFDSRQNAWEFIDCFEIGIFSYQEKSGNGTVNAIPNIDDAYKKMKAMIEEQGDYSENETSLITGGLIVRKLNPYISSEKLHISIEANSLVMHFPKILALLEIAYDNKEVHSLSVKLETRYLLKNNNIKNSGTFARDGRFSFSQRAILDYPVYRFMDIEFYFSTTEDDSSELHIIFPRKDVSQDILKLVNALYELNIIYED